MSTDEIAATRAEREGAFRLVYNRYLTSKSRSDFGSTKKSVSPMGPSVLPLRLGRWTSLM